MHFAPNDGGPTAAHADLGSHAAAVQTELQAAADKFVIEQGANPDDFYAYVKQQGGGIVNSTALLLFHSRSADTALRPLLTEFKRTSAFRNRK